MSEKLFTVCAILLVASVTGTLSSSSSWSPHGIVEGIKDCGSSGKLGDVSVPDCTVVPCHFEPSRGYDIAIRFTASVTSATLRLQIHEASTLYLLLEFPIDGRIEAGIEYEMKFVLPIHPEWSGAAFDIIFYILDFEATIVEVCAQAAIVIA